MSKFKLTKAGRAVVGVIKFDKKKPTASDKPATNVTTNASTGDDTINLSLDEWAG